MSKITIGKALLESNIYIPNPTGIISVQAHYEIENFKKENENAQEILTQARKIVDDLCSEYACKIDFWTTNYGQKILELKEVLK